MSEDHTVTQANLPVKSDIPPGVSQLSVDVKQSESEIIIFAQVPGTDTTTNLDVLIEGDNDVITIQGNSARPSDITKTKQEGEVAVSIGPHVEEHDEFTLEECAWGKFFRQIILPHEVDPEAAQAKVKDGVLVLRLPLKGHNSNKLRMRVEKCDSE